nr:uncharacterized protein LOC109731151 [Microcebus murinus]
MDQLPLLGAWTHPTLSRHPPNPQGFCTPRPWSQLPWRSDQWAKHAGTQDTGCRMEMPSVWTLRSCFIKILYISPPRMPTSSPAFPVTEPAAWIIKPPLVRQRVNIPEIEPRLVSRTGRWCAALSDHRCSPCWCLPEWPAPVAPFRPATSCQSHGISLHPWLIGKHPHMASGTRQPSSLASLSFARCVLGHGKGYGGFEGEHAHGQRSFLSG